MNARRSHLSLRRKRWKKLNDGVSIPEITHEFGSSAIDAYQPILVEAQQQGLMEYDEHRARLTQQGRLFANDVFQRFLGVLDFNEAAGSPIHQQGVVA